MTPAAPAASTPLPPALRSVTSAGWSIEPTADPEIVLVRPRGGRDDDGAAARLAGLLKTIHGAVAVGARRVTAHGTIASMGEMVVHPKGLHSVGRDEPAGAYRFPEEVDAVLEGPVAVNRAALEVAGADADRLAHAPLGLLETTLALRRAGGRVLVAADVETRGGAAPRLSAAQRDEFRARWGFDPAAPDLDAVRRRYAGTGLLWQARLHAPMMSFDKYEARAALHWRNYEEVPVYRQRADHLVAALAKTATGRRVLDLGCGDGLFAHLFARAGFEVTGVDAEPAAIDLARAETERRGDPRPRFLLADGADLPLPAGSCDAVTMFDVLEHLPNPVPVLREAARVLAVGGHLLLTTPAWCHGAWSDHVHHVTEYSKDEAVALVEAAAGLSVVATGKIGGVYRDVVIVARKGG